MTDKKVIKSKDPTQKALGALKAMLDPKSVIAPPEDFSEEQIATWNELINSKPHESWKGVDRFLLRLWVKTYHDILRLDQEIDAQGEAIENARGTPVMNPLCSVRNACTQQLISLSTKLRITNSSREQDDDTNAGRTQAQKSAKKGAQTIQDDDDNLLAGMSH